MEMIELPPPSGMDAMTVGDAIAVRRSVRKFADGGMSIEELAALTWAGQGVTSSNGRYRAAPSAGALYPIFLYVAVGDRSVEGIDAGVHRYVPGPHALETAAVGDRRRAIASASLGQTFIANAPAIFVVAADYGRITPKYGDRGMIYAHFEAGHVAENIMLAAVALGFGSCAIGAFNDYAVAHETGLRPDESPMLAIPVGRRA